MSNPVQFDVHDAPYRIEHDADGVHCCGETFSHDLTSQRLVVWTSPAKGAPVRNDRAAIILAVGYAFSAGMFAQFLCQNPRSTVDWVYLGFALTGAGYNIARLWTGASLK